MFPLVTYSNAEHQKAQILSRPLPLSWNYYTAPRPTKVLGRLHGSANECAEPAPTSYFFYLAIIIFILLLKNIKSCPRRGCISRATRADAAGSSPHSLFERGGEGRAAASPLPPGEGTLPAPLEGLNLSSS
uniref:Uncharacterized protein n=1 Tax=Morchella importuna TaxID=1174673 RepID=A0A650AFK4_9PEZI|nr:hypothetical protein [Morchella importuna]QGN66681.1 hypothetical protein [Morchella importuna]